MNSYAIYKDNLLIVGNEQIERAVRLDSALPHSEYILDKLADKRWESGCQSAMFNVCDFDFSTASVEFRQYVSDNDGLSAPHICAELVYTNPTAKIRQCFEVYDGSPFVPTRL